VCQDFMNTAAVKYNKITTNKGGFKEFVHTVQEDIMALFASQSKSNHPPKRKAYNDDRKQPLHKPKRRRKPPTFLIHYKDSNDKNINFETLKNMMDRLFIFVMHLHIKTNLNGILIFMISAVYVKNGCKSQEVKIIMPPHKPMLVKLSMLMKISVMLTQTLH